MSNLPTPYNLLDIVQDPTTTYRISLYTNTLDEHAGVTLDDAERPDTHGYSPVDVVAEGGDEDDEYQHLVLQPAVFSGASYLEPKTITGFTVEIPFDNMSIPLGNINLGKPFVLGTNTDDLTCYAEFEVAAIPDTITVAY